MQNSKYLVEAHHFIKNLTGKTKFVISKKSRSLGLSRQTYQNKLDILRSQKIISNFTININPNLLPINLKYVLLEIKTNPNEPELLENLLKISQLKILDGVLGEYSLFALLIFHSSEEYYQVLSIIDKIMAQSYFKKYQIIETIKVFKTNGIELNVNKIDSNFEIDSIDYVILKIMQKNQNIKPISTYEIKDIIKEKYKDALNFCPKKIGFRGKYLVRIKPKDPSKYNEIALNLEKNSFITDLFRIGEQHGLFAIVRVKKVEDYAEFIKILYQSDEIEDTFTSFVLDELVTYTNFIIY
jgi:DNA-binding Lrp family transcriptional regulator